MENTNDKTAAERHKLDELLKDLRRARTLETFDAAAEAIHQHCNVCAEEARREAEQRYKAKLGQFADDAFKAKQRARSLAAALAQRTAGGDAVTLPKRLAADALGALFWGDKLNPEGYERIKQDFAAIMRGQPVAEAAPSATGGDAVKVDCGSCLGTGNDGRGTGCTDCNGKGYDWGAVAEAAAQADDVRTVAGLPLAAVLETAAHYADNGLKSTILAGQLRRIAARLCAAPTAQPTPNGEYVTRDSALAALDHVEQHNGPGRKRDAVAMLEAAQPTPPDDERAEVQNLELVIARLEQIAANTADDYREAAAQALPCAVALRAALRQPGAPADSLDTAMDAISAKWRQWSPTAPETLAVIEAMDDLRRVRARLPGTTSHRTGAYTRVADLSPGVRALHDAIISHDTAAMVLFGRDDQVAWTAETPHLPPRRVTLGHLREVLGVALGLPAGKKYGG